MILLIGLVLGIAIFCGGIYYLIKEKNDAESKKIYTVTTIVGAVIVIAVIARILLMGF